MEQHLPADSPEKFRFRAETLRSASAGILLPRRRAAFSAAAGAAAVAMTAGIQRSILPVFQNLTYSSDYGG